MLIFGMVSMNACKSIPNDEKIQNSINEHFKYNDSLKIKVIGKYKFSDKVYKINYSRPWGVYDDIVLLPLENGQWVLQYDSERWVLK